jgi:hypothetical protein
MGYVSPPLKPNATPEERVAYRAHLVRALGYDPRLEPLESHRRSWWWGIWHGIMGR